MVAAEASTGQKQLEQLKFLTPEVRCGGGRGVRFGLLLWLCEVCAFVRFGMHCTCTIYAGMLWISSLIPPTMSGVPGPRNLSQYCSLHTFGTREERVCGTFKNLTSMCCCGL